MYYGIIIALQGIAMLLWSERRAKAVERRISDGDDRFFEEQRTYRAYPWLGNPSRIRFAGAIAAIGGLSFCVLKFYGF